MQMLVGRVARCDDRVLELVAKARPKALPEIGYVEERGRRSVLNGHGIVQLYFPTQQTKKTVRFVKRMFVADRVEIVKDGSTSPASQEV